MQHLLVLFICLFLFLRVTPALGQCEAAVEHAVALPGATELEQLTRDYGRYKTIPIQDRVAILLALSHFPELRATRIRFRVRHVHGPLTTNRDWSDYLRHFGFGTRAFMITISDSTESRLMPILLGRMDLNAQVGVLGHELSHVSDFSHRHLFGWLRLGIGHLSMRFVDRMEFATDSLCIAHGLGYQLLAWSCFVRQALGIPKYGGSGHPDMPKDRERYMEPKTILTRLNAKDPVVR